MNKVKFKAGRGLDCGTGFLVMARMTEEGQVVTQSIRDAFLEITPANSLVQSTMRKSLLKSGVSFFEDKDKIIILGQDSLTQSVERQVVLKRPMHKGVISPTEVNALPMFKALLKELLGAPEVENEKVIFTVPAKPVDGNFDIVYHTAVIQSILKELGYDGRPINEGHALCFSQLEDSDYSGVNISCGSGMSNIAVTNMADLVCSFSIAKGGDYIDYSTATSLGYDPTNHNNTITPNLVTYIKEQGVDLLSDQGNDKIKIGIVAHYKELIRYLVANLVNELSSSKSITKFVKPIPIVIAGGTSLANGTVELFKEELNKQKNKLPFEISDIKVPENKEATLTAVAQGCLIALLSEE